MAGGALGAAYTVPVEGEFEGGVGIHRRSFVVDCSTRS
jgi:hypothetical protein